MIHQQGYSYVIRLIDQQNSQQLTEQLIGRFGVNRILEVNGEYGVVIGYDLHPKHWKKGYMSEVLGRILSELKEHTLFLKN